MAKLGVATVETASPRASTARVLLIRCIVPLLFSLYAFLVVRVRALSLSFAARITSTLSDATRSRSISRRRSISPESKGRSIAPRNGPPRQTENAQPKRRVPGHRGAKSATRRRRNNCAGGRNRGRAAHSARHARLALSVAPKTWMAPQLGLAQVAHH